MICPYKFAMETLEPNRGGKKSDLMNDSARVMVFSGPGEPLRLQEFDVPEPRGEEILVRVLACTLCGSDIHTFEGRRAVSVPTVLGHEILGRVVSIGPDSPGTDSLGAPLRAGDRVTWSIVASCGRCYCCKRSLPQKCEQMTKYGHEQLQPGNEWTGGLADYCLLATGTSVVKLPDDLSDAAVCPANCATATIAAAVEAAGELQGCNVFIAGAGLLGLTACAISKALGANEVICMDIDHQRLERAQAFGATRTITPDDAESTVAKATDRRGMDVAFEISGSSDACEIAFRSLGLKGRLVLIGGVFPTRPLSITMEQIIRRHLTLTGVHNYAPHHLHHAVRFLTQLKNKPFDAIVSEWLPLEEANRAFELARSPSRLRVGVRPTEQ